MIREWLRRLVPGLRRKRDEEELPQHLRAGEWGEGLAARLLEGKGYTILGRRVRVGDRDELDLVARDGETLVFVEVKTRGGEMFGRPAAAVDRRKRRVMSRAAVRYVERLRNRKVYFRFDVVEVIGDVEDGEAEAIRHIENAFVLDSRYMVGG